MTGIFVVIFTILFFLVSVDGTKFTYYDRHIFSAKFVNVSQAPAPSSIDVTFNRTKAFGCGKLYGDDWQQTISTLASDWLLAQFGLNFKAGDFNPSLASYSLPQGTMYPYILGDDFRYRVIEDVVGGKNQKKTSSWILFNTGYLAIMNGNGTFPGGVMAGKTWAASDVIGYSHRNLLDEDDQKHWGLDNSKSREILIVRSLIPSKNYLNSQGLSQQNEIAEIVDKDGNIGTVQGSVFAFKDSNNIVSQSTTSTITFGRDPRYPKPVVFQCHTH